MLLITFAFAVAFFFAMNIGASGAVACLGVAYGAGAVRNKRIACLISAAGVFLGAVLGGGEVVETIGSGIIPRTLLSVEIALIVLTAATMSLFIANLIGIPLSTSEVTVGAVVGVGIAHQSLFVNNLLVIVSYWILVPVIAFTITYTGGKAINCFERRNPTLNNGPWRKWLIRLLIAAGFFEAFSAGMNNVANSVGVLVGSGLLTTGYATFWGGLFIALGAITLGTRVVETNGKKITELSLLQGSAVSGIGATLVLIASLLGIPVPMTQITTSGILGVGVASSGIQILQKSIIQQMFKIWLVSPVFSLVISYGLVKLVLDFDLYAITIILAVFLATIGSVSLLKREKR